jgi:glutaredoxin
MITVFSARDCALCSQLTHTLRQANVSFQIAVVNAKEADALLARFPQMASSTGLFGLGLPFTADGDRLIGGYSDTLREMLV